MGHENRQYDIPDHLLRAPEAPPRVSMRKDIGQAKITHSIFGRAKVRVIREQDNKRRAWLLLVLAVTALAAASFQGWIALQQSEMIAPPTSLSEKIEVSPPVFQPEEAAPTATPSSGRSKQKTPTEILFDSMATRRPPQPVRLKAAEPTAAKPVTPQPLAASKSQTAAIATSSTSSVNQMEKPKLPAPIKAVAPTVPTPSASQPAADKPAPVAPLAEPLIKESTSASSPAGDSQPSVPVKAQP